MAKLRKRFYVATPNGYGPRQVLALKFTPEPSLFGHSFTAVYGPFRTLAAAELAKTFGTFSITSRSIRAIERIAERRAAA